MPAASLITAPPPVTTVLSVWVVGWRKVSVPAWIAILPVKPAPVWSVSVLAPPVKLMALARVTPSPPRPPVMLPLVTTVMPDPMTPSAPAPAAPAGPPVVVPAAPPLPPAIVPLLFRVAPVANCTPKPPAPPLPPAPSVPAKVLPPPAPPDPPRTVPVFE